MIMEIPGSNTGWSYDYPVIFRGFTRFLQESPRNNAFRHHTAIDPVRILFLTVFTLISVQPRQTRHKISHGRFRAVLFYLFSVM
jgi:hypothetical protein